MKWAVLRIHQLSIPTSLYPFIPVSSPFLCFYPASVLVECLWLCLTFGWVGKEGGCLNYNTLQRNTELCRQFGKWLTPFLKSAFKTCLSEWWCISTHTGKCWYNWKHAWWHCVSDCVIMWERDECFYSAGTARKCVWACWVTASLSFSCGLVAICVSVVKSERAWSLFQAVWKNHSAQSMYCNWNVEENYEQWLTVRLECFLTSVSESHPSLTFLCNCILCILFFSCLRENNVFILCLSCL